MRELHNRLYLIVDVLESSNFLSLVSEKRLTLYDIVPHPKNIQKIKLTLIKIIKTHISVGLLLYWVSITFSIARVSGVPSFHAAACASMSAR